MSVDVDVAAPPKPGISMSRFVVVGLIGLAAVGLIVAFGTISSAPTPGERLIERAVETWFGGDVAAARLVLLPVPATEGIDIPDDEIVYQGAIGADAHILECDPVGETVFDCQMSYAYALSDAVGRHPVLVPVRFDIVDDRVAVISTYFNRDDYPLYPEIDGSFADFMLIEGLGVEYDSLCFADPVRDLECAQFQLAHLHDWAKWRLAQE
jgi:hypothetical protein